MAGCLTWLLTAGVVMAGSQSADVDSLYACEGAPAVDVTAVGVTICNGVATPELRRRADVDNLQVREGVLVVDLERFGVSAVAGLQADDLIYRVRGVNVHDIERAMEQLSNVDTSSDTIVNFLRGGRPYRVKLRQD